MAGPPLTPPDASDAVFDAFRRLLVTATDTAVNLAALVCRVQTRTEG